MPTIECVQACTVTLALAPPDYEAWGITPTAVLSAFGFGVGAVLLLWSIGYVTGIALRIIRAL